MSISGSVFYPNISVVPEEKVESPKKASAKQSSEFDHLLKSKLEANGLVKEPLKFSTHATQRIKERKIEMNPEMMVKMNSAVDRAAEKGIEESLVLTEDAAFVVSVKNRTVITALDKNGLAGNVFTNIDGAIVV